MNQVETHPFFPQSGAAEIMKEIGVQHEAWGQFAEGKNDLFQDPVLSSIASDHGRSVAQVVLRWLLQRGLVVTPIGTAAPVRAMSPLGSLPSGR